MPRRPTSRALVASLVLSFAPAGCGDPPPNLPVASSPTPATAPVTLRLFAFSAAREAFGTRLLPAFARQWSLAHSQPVEFAQTYASSGGLASAMAAGLEADVLVLAQTRDLDELIRTGAVQPAAKDRAPDVLCRSLVLIAVRKGNPHGIRDWADLARSGIGLVIPDPATSGCGMWAASAIYGAALRGHAGTPAKDANAARELVRAVFANVVNRGENARDSFRAFLNGTGDAAITYESELEQAWMFGHDEERVLPGSTVLVEHPVVLVARNVAAHGVRDVADGLLQFLHSQQAQRQLAFCGLRPIDATVAAERKQRFPTPADLWSIADLGGWPQVVQDVLQPLGFDAVPSPTGK